MSGPPPVAIASPLIEIDFGEARKATTYATSRASTRWRIEFCSARRRSTSSSGTPCARHALGDHLRRALGAGAAGVDDGDVDAVRPEFVREVLRQRGDGDVAHAARGVARAARPEPGDVDDPAPALRAHDRRDRPRGAQVAQHLDLDVRAHVVVRQLSERHGRQRAARRGGVVDEDVDASERLVRGLHHRLHRGVVGHVGGQRQHPPAALRGDLGGGRLQRLATARDDGDIGALEGQFARHGLADSTARAGHDRHLARQFQVHAVPPASARPRAAHRTPPGGRGCILARGGRQARAAGEGEAS